LTRTDFTSERIPDGFVWLNEPARVAFDRGLVVTTKPDTDFWQRTHYGFRRDDGHCLLTPRTGDFALTTSAEITPRARYDQCGLMVRVDAENWIKASVEYENPRISRLGSVVTNLGYSDWATQDIATEAGVHCYRIQRRGSDFLVEHSRPGQDWRQMRIAHLHTVGAEVLIGIYACSPEGGDLQCRFTSLDIGDTDWPRHA
jgi:regulation of enolase protein 1 (concanavalin A-like superfamily)